MNHQTSDPNNFVFRLPKAGLLEVSRASTYYGQVFRVLLTRVTTVARTSAYDDI